MESDDESRKIKKRPSIFRSRFAKKEKEKDSPKPDKKRSKSQDWDSSRKERVDSTAPEKEKKKGKLKDKEKDKMLKKKAQSVSGATAESGKKAEEDAPEVKPIFGVPLAKAVECSKMYDGVELPRVVRECIDYVEEHGLDYAGIYRLAGVKSKVELLKSRYNTHQEVDLKEYDPTIVTSLLKLYLRELPESVLTTKLLPQFEEASKIEEQQSKLQVFQMVLKELPSCHYALLSWMVLHLSHVLDNEAETKMTIQNISIVMCPTLRISHRVLNLLFLNHKALFRGVQIKKCRKLLKWHPNIVSELPDDPVALEDELQRHEAILNRMHEDLQKGIADKSTEDELWEVQRVVTQLKRKLRVSRRVSETRIAEKEKEQKGKHVDIKTGEKGTPVKRPASVASPSKTKLAPTTKSEVKSPLRHSQKGPAPKVPVSSAIPELPPKKGDRPKGDRPKGDRPKGDRPKGDRPKGDRPKGDRPKSDRPKSDAEPTTKPTATSVPIQFGAIDPKPIPSPPVDKIEADLKKVAEKLEREPEQPAKALSHVDSRSSTLSTRSTKEKMEELKNGDGVKRDFPEELTESDDDTEEDQGYDVPPPAIVVAPCVPRIPEKQSRAPALPEKAAQPVEQEDMEMIRLLLLSQAEVFAETEELVHIRNELQKRIESERQEMERLKANLGESKHKGRGHSRSSSIDSYEEGLVSPDDSSSSGSDDEEELMDMMNSLMLENQELERKNTLLSHDMHNEREAIVELKVKIKLLQDGGPSILADLSKAQLKTIYAGDTAAITVNPYNPDDSWADRDLDVSADSSVFDASIGISHRKAETLPKMAAPNYAEQGMAQSRSTDADLEQRGVRKKMEKETSL